MRHRSAPFRYKWFQSRWDYFLMLHMLHGHMQSVWYCTTLCFMSTSFLITTPCCLHLCCVLCVQCLTHLGPHLNHPAVISLSIVPTTAAAAAHNQLMPVSKLLMKLHVSNMWNSSCFWYLACSKSSPICRFLIENVQVSCILATCALCSCRHRHHSNAGRTGQQPSRGRHH